jgi:hypothetical protein
MELTAEQQTLLEGGSARATRKAMEILVALGEVFDAERLLPVRSVQVSGVSFSNLGEEGLAYLEELAGEGRAVVPATLNPAGMDLSHPERMGIDTRFIERQRRVVAAYQRLGIAASCTCTPYLAGNLPAPGDTLAWSESSAVTYANSVIGARTNREGGPSALAAALTGFTPDYGFHRDEKRRPSLRVVVEKRPADLREWGLLGRLLGERSEGRVARLEVPGPPPGVEALKTLCAALPTYGGAPLFLMSGISPEADRFGVPTDGFEIGAAELALLSEGESQPAPRDQGEQEAAALPELVCLGCPHATLAELQQVVEQLAGRLVLTDFWICTSRPVKALADSLGITTMLEQCGALVLTDTCFVVAPLKGRYGTVTTNSAKGVYYAAGHGGMRTRLLSTRQCVERAVGPEPEGNPGPDLRPQHGCGAGDLATDWEKPS